MRFTAKMLPATLSMALLCTSVFSAPAALAGHFDCIESGGLMHCEYVK
jgi:hypothetical protein